MLTAAVKLGWHAVKPLSDENPAKIVVRSVLSEFGSKTKSLPGKGVLPLNPKARLISLRETAWLVVSLSAAMYLMALADGEHPLVELYHALI